jgi:hypothetical protein
MKVLIVNNGEWIPEDGFDIGKYIRSRKRPYPGHGRGAANGRLQAV